MAGPTQAVDRIGRSLRHLLEFLEELQALKIDLFLHQQGLDSSTPSGIALFQIAGVFSQWERAIIRERVLAGLARIQAGGKTKSGNPLGRPRISPQKEQAIITSLQQGNGIEKTARLVKCGVGTVIRVKQAQKD
jgi:DNA invertase Pin-like site-specific DNA recombinase